jgi:hypothetical protein
MYRFITLFLVTGMALTGAIAVGTADRERSSESQTATDGAYRDGLFVGRFAAEQGRSGAAPIGRWSSERDRASFAAGYRLGSARLQTNP